MKRKLKGICCVSLSISVVSLLFGVNVGAQSVEEATTIAELKAIIRQQQEQLDAQAKAIAALQQVLPLQDKTAVPSSSIDSKLHVKTRSNKVDVTLYGQINRALMHVDDSHQNTWRHVDADTSGTRIGITANKKINEDLDFGGKFEVEYQSNGSNRVSMDVDDYDEGLKKRHMDIYLHSSKFGKLSLGQGDTASNGTSESDLSGVMISGVHVGVHDLPTSFIFYNKSAGDYSTTTGSVGDFFSSMDGLSRRDRIRYDSPAFAGFSLSGSLTEKDGDDLALRYNHTFPHIKVRAACAYANPGKGSDYEQANGSLSVRHDSGVSLTLAGAHRDYNESTEQNASFYYGKLAYETILWETGATAFGIDYGQWDDLSHTLYTGDDANSYGMGIVQNVTDWSTEFYAAYRIYTLERSGIKAEFGDINVFWSGVRFKF